MKGSRPLLLVGGLTFGHPYLFGVLPPRVGAKVMNEGMGCIHLVKPSRIIVCEHHDSFHYLIQSSVDDELKHCLWGHRISQQQKMILFHYLRRWYHEVSNSTLQSDFSVTDDSIAWYLSRRLGVV